MYLAVKGDKKSMFFSNVVNSDPKPWLWKNEPSKALKNTHTLGTFPATWHRADAT